MEKAMAAATIHQGTVLTVMGMATERLGLGATYSTSYYEPFHVARVFATLDLMTRGRVAWNVVTSLNDGEAQNMGRDEVFGHDLRYDRADEFMEIVLGHWDAWEDDAIVQDKATGLFAKADKVHRLDYAGRYFRSRGPFTVPRSAQGHPVIIQAGSSGRGKAFGARWGDIIFVVYPGIDTGKRDYADFKAEVARSGRDPEAVKITHLVNTVAAATRTEAEDKWAAIEKLPLEIDALSLLSEALNFDFAKKAMDEPFTAQELADMSGLQGIRDRVLSVKKNPTVRDFITISGCLSRELARHFGDESSVPQDRCGNCQYCLTGVAVQFTNSEPVKKSITGLKYCIFVRWAFDENLRLLLSYYRMREVGLPIAYKASGQFTINGCLKHTGTRSLASFKEPDSPRQSDLDSS